MADIRTQIWAITRREQLGERMQGRSDIILWAPALIAAQDSGHAGLPSGLIELPADFPAATEMAELLIQGTELQRGSAGGLPVPGGVRHPLLHLSPVLQFARRTAADGCVHGRTFDEVPSDFSTLTAWLERSIGLRPAKDIAISNVGADPALDLEEARVLFERRFTFSLEHFARWLIGIRSRDPALYLLLLSREYRLALGRCAELGMAPASGSPAAAAMPNLKLPPILAAMTIGELQRMVALTRELSQRSEAVVSRVIDDIADRHEPKVSRGRRMAGAISRGEGRGFLYDHAPMRVEAIRKRVFLLHRRDLSTLDRDSFLHAVFGGHIDWDHVMSAGRRVGAHELIATMLAPEIFRKRRFARGLGHHNDPLDLYYGVRAGDLPYVASIELGTLFRSAKDREGTAPLADHMRAIATGTQADPGGARERKHRRAVEYRPLYLRPYPKPGAGGRFVAVAWLDPVRDAVLYKRLLRPVIRLDPQTLRSGTRWMLPIALRYLQLSFPKLYQRLDSHGSAARIMAHLASSAAAFTSDPIFYGILAGHLTRASEAKKKFKGAIRKKSNLAQRDGSPSLLALLPEILDRATRPPEIH